MLVADQYIKTRERLHAAGKARRPQIDNAEALV